MNPPPIPHHRQVRFATFYGKRAGIVGSNMSTLNLDQAQTEAAAWMNAYPAIEIITIKTVLTDHLAAVTVWYRA